MRWKFLAFFEYFCKLAYHAKALANKKSHGANVFKKKKENGTQMSLPVLRVSSNEKTWPKTLENIDRKMRYQYHPRGVAKKKND